MACITVAAFNLAAAAAAAAGVVVVGGGGIAGAGAAIAVNAVTTAADAGVVVVVGVVGVDIAILFLLPVATIHLLSSLLLHDALSFICTFIFTSTFPVLLVLLFPKEAEGVEDEHRDVVDTCVDFVLEDLELDLDLKVLETDFPA